MRPLLPILVHYGKAPICYDIFQNTTRNYILLVMGPVCRSVNSQTSTVQRRWNKAGSQNLHYYNGPRAPVRTSHGGVLHPSDSSNPAASHQSLSILWLNSKQTYSSYISLAR